MESLDLTENDFKKIIEDWEFDYDIPLTDDEIVYLIDAFVRAQKEKRNPLKTGGATKGEKNGNLSMQ